MKPRPPPQTLNRRAAAALAARSGPAKAMIARRGVLSRVPMFGVRTFLNNRSARVAAAAERARAAEGGFDGGGQYEPARQALEEATKSLLLEVGGNRQEAVMAAAANHKAMTTAEDQVAADEPEPVAPHPSSTPPASVTMMEANPTTNYRSVVTEVAPPPTAAAPVTNGDVLQGAPTDGNIEGTERDAERKNSGRRVEGVKKAWMTFFSRKSVDDAEEADDGTATQTDPLVSETSKKALPAVEMDGVAEEAVGDHEEEEEDRGKTTLSGRERRRDAVRVRRAEIRAQRAEVRRRRAAELATRREDRERCPDDGQCSSFAMLLPQRRGKGRGRWRRWWVRVRARGRKKSKASPEKERLIELLLALSPPRAVDGWDVDQDE